MTVIEIIKEEIAHKSKFMQECIDNDDQENSEYWRAWVHGARFALDVIQEENRK